MLHLHEIDRNSELPHSAARVRGPIRTIVAAGVIATLVVAGCAGTVAGSSSATASPSPAEAPVITTAQVAPITPAPAPAAQAIPDPATDPFAAELANHDPNANDPVEPLNRYFFEVNLVLDNLILEPAARGYRFILPKPARRSVGNFLHNLGTPVILANDLFQGEFERAGETLGRFVVNTTVGVGGLFDPAADWIAPRHSEDFGQTLGTYGVGEGPYFVAPVIGPAPPRDLAGRGVDVLLDPLTWIGGPESDAIQIGRFVGTAIHEREQGIEAFEEIERSSLDLYVTVRSIYRQARDTAIANGQSTAQGDEDFPEFPELNAISPASSAAPGPAPEPAAPAPAPAAERPPVPKSDPASSEQGTPKPASPVEPSPSAKPDPTTPVPSL